MLPPESGKRLSNPRMSTSERSHGLGALPGCSLKKSPNAETFTPMKRFAASCSAVQNWIPAKTPPDETKSGNRGTPTELSCSRLSNGGSLDNMKMGLGILGRKA